MGGEGGHVEADETFIGGKARNMLERRFLFARCLASQFFVGHALICDLRYNFREAVTVVHVFAIVEAKGLLIEVTEKIETARH